MEEGNIFRTGIYPITGHNMKVFALNVVFLVLASCASLPKDNIPVRSAPPLQVDPTKLACSDECKQKKSPPAPICQSNSCKAIAKLIQKVRNASVDPCDNFYEYACGQWIKDNPVPKGHLQFSRITQLSKNNERVMKENLIADRPGDTETLMKVKNFYRSCLNKRKIDKLGNQPLLNYIDSLGSWSLADKWNAKDWDFYDTLANEQKNYPVEVFFSVNIIQDPVQKKGSEERKYVILVSINPKPRDDQAIRLNPLFMPYSKGNPSQVIFSLRLCRLPGIMQLVPRVLLECFRGQ